MAMCRYLSIDDEGYKKVLKEIQILVSGIQKRMEQAVLEKERVVANLQTGSSSTNSYDQY
jgi:hypothetical protein